MYNELLPIDWEAFHFLRPKFLWLFLAVGGLTLISLLLMKQELAWKKIIAPHLRPYVISKGNNKQKALMHLLLLLAMSCGIVGLAGPTWKKKKVPGQQLETPMVVLLDLSPSMLAEDIQPTRLDRAKFKIDDLIKHKPRARMALVAFAGTAHTVVPLTKDYSIITANVENLKPKNMPFPGADLKSALKLADSLTLVTDAPGTLVLLSDDFGDDEVSAIRDFKAASKNKIIILPMNTPNGAEVPKIQGRGSIRDGEGNPIRSQLNIQYLSELNSIEGIQVQQITLDDSDVDKVAMDIRKDLIFKEKDKDSDNDWRDVGLLCIIPMALIMLFWFRKGWVLYSLVFVLLTTSCNSSTPTSEDKHFADLWYTRDYQGQKEADKGDFEKAAQLYTDPMRKGVAYYKSGDYQAAIDAFSQDTTAQGAYNLGLAYYENGDYAAAQLAFGTAVEKDPEMEAAKEGQQQLMRVLAETDSMTPQKAEEAPSEGKQAQNRQNKSMEDLSGGGQEATKKDMEKERLEEDVQSNIHKGKELDEVPDNIKASKQEENGGNIIMRKVDDDPALFLQKKFKYQTKKYNIKPGADAKQW